MLDSLRQLEALPCVRVEPRKISFICKLVLTCELRKLLNQTSASVTNYVIKNNFLTKLHVFAVLHIYMIFTLSYEYDDASKIVSDTTNK